MFPAQPSISFKLSSTFFILILSMYSGAARDGGGNIEDALKQAQEELKGLEELHGQLQATFADPAPEAKRFLLSFNAFEDRRERFGNKIQLALVVPFTVFGDRFHAATAYYQDRAARGDQHQLDTAALKFDGKKLTGHFVLYENELQTRYSIIEVELDLTGTAAGTYRRYLSRFTLEEAAEQRKLLPEYFGSVNAVIQPAASEPGAPIRPGADLTASVYAEHYKMLQYLEARAEYYYQEIRALKLAEQYRLPLMLARSLAPKYKLYYPPLPTVSKSGKVAPKNKAPSVEDLLGDSTELGLEGGIAGGLGDNKDRAGQDTEKPLREFVLKHLHPALERIKQRRSLAAQHARSPLPLVTGNPVSDPHFGPFYGHEVLPSNKRLENVLPSSDENGTPQRWAAITNWTCLGLWPYGDRSEFELSHLPEIIPAQDLGVVVERGLIDGEKDKAAPEYLPAETGVAEAGTGRVRLPFYARATGNRRNNPATVYALAQLHSEAERKVWLGITVDDHGKLWINDTLVWKSTRLKRPERTEELGLVEVSLKAGLNRLLVRFDNKERDTYFSLSVCLQGKPRNENEFKSAIETARLAQERLRSSDYYPLGWRGDFNGHYKAATTPPLAWDAEKGINVRWRVPLELGFSTPIVVGQKVFTLEDPHFLLCLNRNDGKLLWKAELDIVATMSEELKKEAQAIKASEAAAQAELDRLGSTDGDRIAALQKTGLDEKAAQEKLREMKKPTQQYISFLQHRAGIARIGWYRDIGYTYPTPVSDGRYLYIKLGTGALACVDLDGNTRWLVNHGLTTVTSAATTSPLLADGKLFVFSPSENRGKEARRAVDTAEETEREQPPPVAPPQDKRLFSHLAAFDPTTGQQLWITQTAHPGEFCGTPVAMQLSNGKETMWVLVTPNGALIRAHDGKVLKEYLGAHELYGSPVCRDNVVILSGPVNKAAFELILQDRDTVGVKPLWFRAHPGVFQDGNYGLFLDGNLYFSRPNLDVTSLNDGMLRQLVDNIFFTQPGRGYPPLAHAGGFLYAADNGTWFQPTYRPHITGYPSACTTLLPGEKVIPLARNRFEQIHGGFSFDGDALFVRARGSLTCLGYTGADGEKWEAETVAAEVLGQIFPELPVDEPPLAIAAKLTLAEIQEHPQWTAWTDDPTGSILSWLFCGPCPAADRDALASQLSDPAFPGYRKAEDVKLGSAENSAPLRVLNAGAMNTWAMDGPFQLYQRQGFGKGPHIGWATLLSQALHQNLWVKSG